MLEISQELKEKFMGDSVRKVVVINFPNGELFPISNQNIMQESMILSEILCDQDQIKFGQCNSAMFEIQIAGVGADIVGKEIEVKIGIDDEYVPLGRFIIDSAKKVTGTQFRKIIAYDKIKLFDRDVTTWYNNLSFPMTVKQFRDALLSHVGILQEEIALPADSFQITKTVNNNVTAKILIENLCEINGCFGCINRYGVFSYRFIESSALYPSDNLFPDEDLFPNDGNAINLTPNDSSPIIGRPTVEEYSTENITGVGIYDDNGIFYLSGNNLNPYYIVNNIFLNGRDSVAFQQITDIVNQKINGVSYRPFEANVKGQPYIERGDNIYIHVNGDIIDSYVLRRELTGIQALKDVYSARGDQFLYYDTNSMAQQIARLERENRRVVVDLGETQEQVSNKVDQGTISTGISNETGDINISGNRFSLDADNIYISEDGTLHAQNAEIEGKITSSSAQITGGTIQIETSKNYSENFIKLKYLSPATMGVRRTYETSFSPERTTIYNKNEFSETDYSETESELNANALRINDKRNNKIISISYDVLNGYDCDATFHTVTQMSDIRKKENIRSIPIKILEKLRPKLFNFVGDEKLINHFGLIAQDVIQAFEELGLDYRDYSLVVEGEDGYFSLNYTELIPLLIKDRNDMQKRLENLEKMLNVGGN